MLNHRELTNSLDKIASEVENHPNLQPQERIIIARMLDEVSDDLDKLEKLAAWLEGDDDEAHYMDRAFDNSGVIPGSVNAPHLEDRNQEGGPQADPDEPYMTGDYGFGYGIEQQGVAETYEVGAEGKGQPGSLHEVKKERDRVPYIGRRPYDTKGGEEVGTYQTDEGYESRTPDPRKKSSLNSRKLNQLKLMKMARDRKAKK